MKFKEINGKPYDKSKDIGTLCRLKDDSGKEHIVCKCHPEYSSQYNDFEVVSEYVTFEEVLAVAS